jgi:hypothetical protein
LDHFKKLADEKKRYFLFKYEIGISETAISRALGVSRKSVGKGLEQAEAELHEAMEESGYTNKQSLHRLYRESRVVKPPAAWDREIIDSFNMWIKQTEQPNQSDQATEGKGEFEGIVEKLGKIKDQVKTRLSEISVNRRSSPKSRVRKLS